MTIKNDDCPVRFLGPLATIKWHVGVAQRLLAYTGEDFAHKAEIASQLARAEEEINALRDRDESDAKQESEAA